MATQFPHLPVLDHAGATANFEFLQPRLDAPAQVAAGTVGKTQLATEVREKLEPSAWMTPTGFSVKLEETTPIQARTEQGGTSARLKGLGKATAAIPAKTTLFTLPVAVRPPVEVRVLAIDATTGKALYLAISTAGVVQAPTTEPATEITSGHFVGFDSITWNLV